ARPEARGARRTPHDRRRPALRRRSRAVVARARPAPSQNARTPVRARTARRSRARPAAAPRRCHATVPARGARGAPLGRPTRRTGARVILELSTTLLGLVVFGAHVVVPWRIARGAERGLVRV